MLFCSLEVRERAPIALHLLLSNVRVLEMFQFHRVLSEAATALFKDSR